MIFWTCDIPGCDQRKDVTPRGFRTAHAPEGWQALRPFEPLEGRGGIEEPVTIYHLCPAHALKNELPSAEAGR